jgi:uncharacterized membrane protein
MTSPILATIKGRSATVAIADMVWGAVLTGLVAAASYILADWVKV